MRGTAAGTDPMGDRVVETAFSTAPAALAAAVAVVALMSFATTTSVAEPPAGYYSTVDSTNAQTLRVTLHEVIDDHIRYPYTSFQIDTWDILEFADEDPVNSSRIVDVYRNVTFPKQGGGNGLYQREHSWPNSYGFPVDHDFNYPFTDCHHLFLCDGDYNFARSNKPYDTCHAKCDEWPTLFNHNRGGGKGTHPGNSNWTEGEFSEGTWETWIGRRGDVARALMYMDVRYEGGVHGKSNMPEPDLILTDNRNLIQASSQNRTTAYMGVLSVLLEWHRQDPPDAFDQHRNDVVFAFQGNRNPFIDHPEWAECLFADDCGHRHWQTNDLDERMRPWLNEIHYDNSGADTGEFIEIAGRSGTNLRDWMLVLYNGATGQMYDLIPLNGVVPNQSGGFGTLSFSIAGIQNGAPDGVALVYRSNQVLQFLSYEGTFKAADGPAEGMASTDIGVEENSSTPVGFSLQLTGVGRNYNSFTWIGPADDSPGSVNAGQSFE